MRRTGNRPPPATGIATTVGGGMTKSDMEDSLALSARSLTETACSRNRGFSGPRAGSRLSSSRGGIKGGGCRGIAAPPSPPLPARGRVYHRVRGTILQRPQGGTSLLVGEDGR